MKAAQSKFVPGADRHPFNPAPADPRSPDAALLVAVLLSGIVAIAALAGDLIFGWLS